VPPPLPPRIRANNTLEQESSLHNSLCGEYLDVDIGLQVQDELGLLLGSSGRSELA
jgi:hypothetical protein